MNKKLVAVYGSLRKGLGNHRLLEDAEYLGEFVSEPVFNLYSLGGFPGLKEGGNTPVVMEVYEVTPIEANRIDQLEGYTPGREATFYDKIPIDTPFGEASVYTYVRDIPEDRLLESGDWKQHIEERYKTPTY